jgi:hypothetical protein
MIYTEVHQRSDRDFLVGATYGREAEAHRIEQAILAERITVDAREGDWHLGVRAGLARALDIIREVRS